MQTAWHAFAVWGRPAHPRLRVCFAMLAGLAPLHRERLVARGGRAGSDPDVFLDTSSYGARAVDAVVREVGVDRLVHGSDRPVIPAAELSLGDAVEVALRERNPARLLGPAADRGRPPALHRDATGASCASWSRASPPTRSGGGRWCATTPASATSSSSGATTTSTCG